MTETTSQESLIERVSHRFLQSSGVVGVRLRQVGALSSSTLIICKNLRRTLIEYYQERAASLISLL